jgi:hypothetical protein
LGIILLVKFFDSSPQKYFVGFSPSSIPCTLERIILPFIFWCKVSDLERDLKDLNFNKLSFDEQLRLEGEINVNEASKVLQTRGS